MELGSSPHTWRIQLFKSSIYVWVRIISTYVENTIYYNSVTKYSKDHLHIRGEYNYMVLYTRPCLGSSPHTWRILLDVLFLDSKLRIISTYVENTVSTRSIVRWSKDHLHIRGEYVTYSQ